MTISVRLLADVPDLIEPIGRMRFAEWGTDDNVDEWISITRREAGHDDRPRCCLNVRLVFVAGLAGSGG